MQSKNEIIAYLKKNTQARVVDLVNELGISRQMVHRHLNSLRAEDSVYKVGRPPEVYYLLRENLTIADYGSDFVPEVKLKQLIDQHFIYLSALGEREDGWLGFLRWCKERCYLPETYAKKYRSIWQKYSSLRKYGFYSGLNKLKITFSDVALKQLFYADLYSIEIFGKTKLGKLLLYAKQSQSITLMKEVFGLIELQVADLLDRYQFDAIGFIPPSVKREVQFMTQLARNLDWGLPEIEIKKVQHDIIIPQKTLSKVADRVKNAERTLLVTERRKYKRVLLVDDAVGSGSTLNVVARKLRNQGVANEVFGFAVTGSAKGFEVISEV